MTNQPRMTHQERLDRRKLIVGTAILAVATGGLAWVVGVSPVQCLLLASAVVFFRVTFGFLAKVDEEHVLPPLDDSGRSHGARREVSRLSWTMVGQDNRVGEIPFRRLRALAATRLRLRGIDPGDESGQQAARELLGDLCYDTLVGELGHPPSVAVFERCLVTLEKLDDVERSRL